VSAISRPDGDLRDSRGSTLGDLLYADKAKARVPEADWVDLVRAIAGGDQLALHSLYGRTHRLAFTLIMRIVNNRETAEELTVDVFHEVWKRADRYDPAGGTVVGWIMNQARSRAIDRLRFERRKKRTTSDTPELHTENIARGSDEALEIKDQRRLVRDALVSLTPAEREVIETAFLSEKTYAEVATQLNQPLGTVKTRIRSGLVKLRRVLAAEAEEP
jgi:RNA polymerase sigma-70 factor, ECF subfamily